MFIHFGITAVAVSGGQAEEARDGVKVGLMGAQLGREWKVDKGDSMGNLGGRTGEDEEGGNTHVS